MSNLDTYLKTKFNPKRPTGLILALKRNTNNMLNELVEATSFLEKHYLEPSIKQRAYHYLNKLDDSELFCKYCGDLRQIRPVNARMTGDLFYTVTCNSDECKNKYNYEQTEKGVLKKYGVNNISQTQLWHDKVKATNLERRGVEWNTQSKKLIEAVKQSMKLNKNDIVAKRKETCYKKYGKSSFLETNECKQAAIDKSIEMFGEKHPMQNLKERDRRIKKLQKTVFKYKEYTLPSGKIVKVQGYEPKALNMLLEKYDESDLIIKDKNIEKKIGKIMYNLDGVDRRYYPDIFIIPENKIVEVKSSYTYEADKEKNLAKMEACIKKGLSFEFLILE